MTTPEGPKHLEARTDQPFTPPASRPLYPWALLMLALVVAAWFGLRGFQEATPPVADALTLAAPLTSPPLRPPDAGRAATASSSRPQAKAMKRCTLNGQVSYTDGDCPAQAQMAVVDIMPNSGWTGSPSAARTTIQRCKTSDNRYFWSATPCRQRQAQVDWYASVTAGMPFAQQVREAEQQRRVAVSSNPPASLPGPTASLGDNKAWRCKALDDEIAHLDARARQPLTAREQDRIRARRKAARDQQFAWGC